MFRLIKLRAIFLAATSFIISGAALNSLPALGAGESPYVEAPFATIEDMRRYAEITERKSFRWLYQKHFIARIFEKALVERGFDAKTAAYLALNWDAWRYDLETGRKIMDKRPLRMTAADAEALARAMPECLRDLASTNCKIRFAHELGCELEAEKASICNRNLAVVRSAFPAYSPREEFGIYPLLACMAEGGKGAEMPVFETRHVADANKLKFQAVKDASNVKLRGAAKTPPQAKPARKAAACEALMTAEPGSQLNKTIRAEFDRDIPELHVYDVRTQISQLISDTQRQLWAKRDGSHFRKAAVQYGIELRLESRGSLTLPAAADMVRSINDLRMAWIGAHVTGRDEKNPRDDAIGNGESVLTELSGQGPAARAGLLSGDRVIRFNGEQVNFAVPLHSLFRHAIIGHPVPIVVRRGSVERQFQVTPTAILDDAENGDVLAMRVLARYFHKEGNAGEIDNVLARSWYEKASRHGDRLAMIGLARLHFGTASGPTEGLIRDEASGRRWLERAADAGDADAMAALAVSFRDGLGGGVRDETKARALFEQAANSSHVPSMIFIGVMQVNGSGGPVDYAKARYWLEQAAARNDATAMANLGVLYEHGLGVARNTATARQWYQRAIDHGSERAKQMILNMR